MVKFMKSKRSVPRILLLAMLIVSLLLPAATVQAQPAIEGEFRVLHYFGTSTGAKFETPQNTRDGIDPGQQEGAGEFQLYSVPVSVTTYKQALPYVKDENRLYCVELPGSPKFIMKEHDSTGEDGIYTHHGLVEKSLNEIWGTTKEDFKTAGRALSYAKVTGVDPANGQSLVYICMRQAKLTPDIFHPTKATTTYADIDRENSDLSTENVTTNGHTDMISESMLATLRIATKPKETVMTVTHPGTHQFPGTPGYAIAGMKGESKSDGLTLDAELVSGVKRETLQKLTATYQPSFQIADDAPDGTYTFTISRPDLRETPTWETYSSNTVLKKSGQWLATFDQDVKWVTDTFTVHYTNQQTEEPTTEAPTTEEPPVTEAPVTEPPATEAPATEEPVTEAPVTEPPATEEPVTEPPTTEAPTTEEPAKEPSVTKPTEPQPSTPATVSPSITTITTMNGGAVTANQTGGNQTQVQNEPATSNDGTLLSWIGEIFGLGKHQDPDTSKSKPSEDTKPTEEPKQNQKTEEPEQPTSQAPVANAGSHTVDGDASDDTTVPTPTFTAQNKSQNKSQRKSNAPQTGDVFRIAFWSFIALACAIGLVVLQHQMKREKRSHAKRK
ncbi:MAG: hypothetical protein PUJ57_04465 [Peptoniphilaceae bacterium]|nr:hypothetical protein [Peptoniphilaceae bacterium]MDY6085368.1 hypothetical protein [Peptoniphilaceae bacterium]